MLGQQPGADSPAPSPAALLVTLNSCLDRLDDAITRSEMKDNPESEAALLAEVDQMLSRPMPTEPTPVPTPTITINDEYENECDGTMMETVETQIDHDSQPDCGTSRQLRQLIRNTAASPSRRARPQRS